VERKRALLHPVAARGREFDQRRSRDTREDPEVERRRPEHVAVAPPHVRDRALQDDAVSVHEHRLVGAGPAGFYAAEHLLRQDRLVVLVDMLDRLPTPFGLVRFGVAPDHQKIKSVTAVFDKTASHPDFRFFGNVGLGTHLTVADLDRSLAYYGDALGLRTLEREDGRALLGAGGTGLLGLVEEAGARTARRVSPTTRWWRWRS